MDLPLGHHGAPQMILGPSLILVSSSLPITFYNEFLKGKPLILGIIFIVAAITQIALGIWSYFIYPSLSVFSGIIFWAPIFYIITGSLMIAGGRKSSICLVSSSMILNILNSFFSFIAIILVCAELRIISNFDLDYFISQYHQNPYVPLSFVLISDLLLLCISITSAVFAGRSMRHVPSIPQTFQFQGTAMASSAPPAPTPQQMMPYMGQNGTQNRSTP